MLDISNFKIFLSTQILPWFFSNGLKILLIIIGVFILNKILRSLIEKLVKKLIVPSRYHSKEAEEKREDTLIEIFNSAIKIVIIIIAGIMILQSLDIPVGPILATAGVAGLALGFGGQYLIRDIITGLFIIMENQYRVGDIICSGDDCGVVEDISLRMTTLRDLDGNVHHIPHGEIKTITNLSKSYSRVNLNVGVSYDSDLEKVIKVVNKVGLDLSKNPDWRDSIIKAPQFLRVNNFGDSSIDIKILGDTQPGKQWAVTGELRLRIKIAFDKEGIEIPFPQRVIYHKER